MKNDNDNHLPPSRAEAKIVGSIHYFTGLVCRCGHTEKRLTSNGVCVGCARAGIEAWVKRNPGKQKENFDKWYADNSNRVIASAKKWKKGNPDKAKESSRLGASKRRAIIRGCEGTHTLEDIADLLRNQKFKCAECGASVKEYNKRHVDHIMPLSKGGANDKSNLQILCRKCNLTKAAKDPIDFARSKGRLF